MIRSIKTLISIASAVFVLASGLVLPKNVYAGGGNSATNIFKQACTGAESSTLCTENKAQPPGNDKILGPNGVLAKVVQLIIAIVGIASVVMIIVGGMKYVLSSGDGNQTAAAKNTILYAVIGLAIAAMAQTIVIFVINKV